MRRTRITLRNVRNREHHHTGPHPSAHGQQLPPQRPHRASKPDRTHYLYLAVIAAVVLGIVVGLVAPDVRQSRQAAGHRRSSP